MKKLLSMLIGATMVCSGTSAFAMRDLRNTSLPGAAAAATKEKEQRYEVSVSSTGHPSDDFYGKYSWGPLAHYKAGETVIIPRIAPNDEYLDYVFNGWTVKVNDGNNRSREIDTYVNSDNRLVFTMPAGDVVLYANFQNFAEVAASSSSSSSFNNDN